MSVIASRPVPRPTSTEVLANLLLGRDDPAPPPLPAATGRGVPAALEEAVLPALRRPPCLVSFSGGRDSSAVLAVAVDVARRHGLPEPVPVMMRFRDAPQTDERTWQELVLDHLRPERREVLYLRDELDALGPLATGFVARHGVRWPGNASMHLPLLALARSGSLLTGIGGDELLGTRGARHVLLARGRERPRRSDLRAVAAEMAPRRVRARRWRRSDPPPYPWLTPAGLEHVLRALAREETSWPHRWDASLCHWRASRAFAAVQGVLGLTAGEYDVQVVNPLVDETVLAELAAAGGATGFASRTAAMRTLFGALLPDAILARETKAAFAAPLWGPAVRAFARAWNGAGVDPALADPEALRAEWLSPEPNFRTVLLLHTAWAAAHGSGQAGE